MRQYLLLALCLWSVLGTEAATNCSSGWKITGYNIPSEKDFKGPKVDLVVGGTKYQFREDFIKTVKMEGDGLSDYGWYLHCCWSKATKIIGACEKELVTMQSVARDPALMRCGTSVEIHTNYLNGKKFIAHDTGPDIKGKHLDVFCGFGEDARRLTEKITTNNAEVCVG